MARTRMLDMPPGPARDHIAECAAEMGREWPVPISRERRIPYRGHTIEVYFEETGSVYAWKAFYACHCGAGADCLNAIVLADGRKIGAFLENPLTTDGVEYVQSAHRDDPSEVTRMWMEHYGIDEHDDEGDED